MIGLTRRQADVLRFIAGHQQAKGFTPSLRAMRDALGYANHSPVQYLIKGLIERGAVADRGDEIEVLHPISISRSPEGEPLFFVRIGEA